MQRLVLGALLIAISQGSLAQSQDPSEQIISQDPSHISCITQVSEIASRGESDHRYCAVITEETVFSANGTLLEVSEKSYQVSRDPNGALRFTEAVLFHGSYITVNEPKNLMDMALHAPGAHKIWAVPYAAVASTVGVTFTGGLTIIGAAGGLVASPFVGIRNRIVFRRDCRDMRERYLKQAAQCPFQITTRME